MPKMSNLKAAMIFPKHSRILVKLNKEKTFAGGVIERPDDGETEDRGVVLAVGPGHYLADGTFVKPDLNVGDEVLFGKYTGHGYILADEDDMHVLLIKNEDIHAVLGKPEQPPAVREESYKKPPTPVA